MTFGFGAKSWCVSRGRASRQPRGGWQIAGPRDHDRRGHRDQGRAIQRPIELRIQRKPRGAGMLLRNPEQRATAPRPARPSHPQDAVAPVPLPEKSPRAPDNPKVAKRIVERIEESVGRLLIMPMSGRPGVTKGTPLLAVPGAPYILVHRVRRDGGHPRGVTYRSSSWFERAFRNGRERSTV
jgi:hypothetical protein